MKLKLTLSLLIGICLGAAAVWFLVTRITGKAFANQYVVGVGDQANVALHIRAGKQTALLPVIDVALPGYVAELDSTFKDVPGSIDTLWLVKAYYQRNKIPFPSEIQRIMDALPPQPPSSCQLRLRALDAARMNAPDAK